MRKLAKLISMLLVLAMLLSVCCFSASAATFKDVSAKDEDLYEAVQLLNTLGIAKGQSETTYGVNKSVTREQMAAFIFRLMKGGKSVEGGDNTTTFQDLEDDTFYAMISWASQSGIIKGRSETEFDPYGGILLQDCYVMLVRALGYEKDGALSYPFGYVDVAERIGLSENLDSKVEYDDELTRGQVAIILRNAFYADMNKMVKKSGWKTAPDGVTIKYIVEERPATVAGSVFDIHKVVRRVVATPSYAIDITPLDPTVARPAEYQAYAPTGKEDVVLIKTAAICPDEDSTRLPKEKATIEFADTGLPGDADDYFLQDIELYIKPDGEIIAANAIGETVEDEKFSAEKVTINDEYDKRKGTGYGCYKGFLSFGTDKAYFYNKPISVKNLAVTIAPTSSDVEGRMTFTANRTWCGREVLFEKDPSVIPNLVSKSTDPVRYQNAQNELHRQFVEVISTADMGVNEGRFSTVYYDCNNDSVIDFLWVQPFTFGRIVDVPGEGNKTTARHTGDSSYRAVYNSTYGVPEIYVGGATVVGGKYENQKYAFAYVSGPGNYVKIAPDDQNAQITEQTTKLVLVNDAGMRKFENGLTIWTGESQKVVVGHTNCDVNGTNGLVPIGEDRSNGYTGQGTSSTHDTNLKGSLLTSAKIGSAFKIVSVGARSLLCTIAEEAEVLDITENYAIVRYADKQKGQVTFDAGGIEADGTLTYQKHVQAFINDQFQIVPIAEKIKKNGTYVNQDDAYFIGSATSPSLVNTICTYTVNEDGEYTFVPVSYSTSTLNLQDTFNEGLAYTTGTQSFVGLEKFVDDVYKFVPAAGSSSLPGELTPNGMQYVLLNDDTKIIVNYINDRGQPDYAVYANGNYPNIDSAASPFTKVVVVLGNNKQSTASEYLRFMYAEIGGQLFDKTGVDKNYRIVLSHMQQLDEKNNVVTKYTVLNPYTGEKTEQVDTYKSTGDLLDKFTLYRITEDGKLQNDSRGKIADLNLASTTPSGTETVLNAAGNLTELVSFEDSANLLFVANKTDAYLVDENTVYALFDRDNSTIEIEYANILKIDDIADTDDRYHNVGATKQQLFVVSEQRPGENLEYASLVIVARGKAR